MRFLLYSHDGFGLGHVRRQLAIAAAVVELQPEARVLLITSVDEVSCLGLPSNVDTLKLPGLRKVGNCRYVSRRLGLRAGDIRKLRSTVALGAVAAFQPDVVLVDKHPLGVDGELREALLAAKAEGAHLVLGLRDILDEPGAVLREWVGEGLFEATAKVYDQILVYGEQRVFDPVQRYCFSDELSRRTRFCGYVLNQPCQSPMEHKRMPPSARQLGRPIVLGTAGGGEDGFELLKTFIEAAGHAHWQGVAVAGPLLADSKFRVLTDLAAAQQLTLHKFIPSLPRLFGEIDVLVSMGGYNTLLEALAGGVPTVCVPRVQPRSEQLIRAQRFAGLGLLRMVRPEHLAPGRLREEIEFVLRFGHEQLVKRASANLFFDGARQAAEYLVSCPKKSNLEPTWQVSQVGG